jgi:hypothetical protein
LLAEEDFFFLSGFTDKELRHQLRQGTAKLTWRRPWTLLTPEADKVITDSSVLEILAEDGRLPGGMDVVDYLLLRLFRGELGPA